MQQTKPSRCAVVGCTDPHRSIHHVPASEETKAKWMDFIFEGNVPERIGKILFVCANHFELDCFTNLGQYNAGLATRLTLHAGSVPSIRRISDEGYASTPGQCARVHHVACQTDRPKMCTVGTQHSVKTPRPHYKSTGTQKTVPCTDVGVGTSAVAFKASQPFLTSTASKRPRLEEEEDNPFDGSSSMDFGEPQDATYDPDDSVTVLTDSADVTMESSNPVHKTPTYIVYENCLLELFEVCPVCRRVTDVRTRRVGTFLSVEQKCPHCQFYRKWNSQPLLGSTPVGNIQLSAAVYATGASFFKLEKSNEVGGSYHMEKEGLKRSLALLEARGVTLDSIVTDRHPQIQKFLREANITHYYDVWHMEKGLSKKLVKIAQNKECEKLKKWLPSIKNHIYWTAATSTSGPERVAKWTSLLNHVQDIHSHDDPVFPQCLHPLRISRDKSKWLTAGTPAFCRLEKVLTNKRVLKDVGKLSPHYQTSSLESFHSVILRFAPKNVVFPFLGMLCRLYLAVLHFNENAGRPQATSSAGEPLFKVNLPKYKKGECTAKPVKADPTFQYVDNLLDLIFHEVFQDPAPYVNEVLKIPIPADLSAQFEKPDKREVIASYVLRFNRGQV
ncbi:uncharacterized protein LOC105908557 isoform X2 [Clupea harengus]|uniref:Uncharacterized protein LOC105908557 isoform X2 n=1 Tax=Clupea harengus TaxID=7950 RepID=A0A6P8F362_CLUHA|nr:uncharacterized protein LOC105908557 isoform X2 [Clupea harengus]